MTASYTFTPAPNFFGSGSATYMASNTKHEVGPAQITINVTNVQDPPVANDDTATVTEDTATDVTSAILANDSDPDGDTLSVTGVSGATGGSVDLTAGVVTFTPAADLCGARRRRLRLHRCRPRAARTPRTSRSTSRA